MCSNIFFQKLFYFRRILYLNRDDCENAIEDIHQLCRDDDDRFQADLLMLREFIKRGNTEMAMTFLDKLEPKKVGLIGSEILEEILLMGVHASLPVKFRHAYHEALNPLWNRLSKHSKGKEKDDVTYIYNVAKAVYGIYSYFGINVNVSVLNGKEKERILKLLFQKVTEFISEGKFWILYSFCGWVNSFEYQ